MNMVDVTLFVSFNSLLSIFFELLLQIRIPFLIVFLIELRHVRVMQSALASVNGLKPLSLLLYGIEFKVYLIGTCANYHLSVVHSPRVNPGKLERDLTLFTYLSPLFFVVNEEVLCQDKVPFFETTN